MATSCYYSILSVDKGTQITPGQVLFHSVKAWEYELNIDS